ncbi:MAG: GreA/GreB family elongation factor [Bacilli bacterium]
MVLLQANPLESKISDESPLGKVILHAKVGDTVLVNTEDGEKFEVKIIDISEELGKKNKSVKKNK